MAGFTVTKQHRRRASRGGTMVYVALVILPALLVVAAADAADSNGNFRVKGIGLETCGKFVMETDAKSSSVLFFRSWLNGYLTAYDQLTPATYDITPKIGIERLTRLLLGYCRKNPQLGFVAAATALTVANKGKRLQERPQAGQTSSVEEAAGAPVADRNAIMRVQRALRDLAFYGGTLDGIYGPGTRGAIEVFQRRYKLPVTGVPDKATLKNLFP